jgi:hypothetical protein
MVCVLMESEFANQNTWTGNIWTGQPLVMFKAEVLHPKGSGRIHITYRSAIKRGRRVRTICGYPVWVDFTEGIREIYHREIRRLRKKPQKIPDCYCLKCMKSVLI